MIKKDYILRLIDELVRVLARVFHLRDLKAYDDALSLLRSESERLIGLDGGMMEVLSADDIRKAVRAPEAALVAGRILEEMSHIYEETGDHARATGTAVKTLDLYTGMMLVAPNAVDGDYRARMSGLADVIAERELTYDDRRTLMRCYGLLGRFADAEDVLFGLLDDGDDRERTVEEGKAFYRRLSEMTDDELRAGGLPRDELDDGMKALDEVMEDPP